MSDETRVEWRDWGPAAFAEADERDRPVLLSLSATWCEGCHEMDAITYAEPSTRGSSPSASTSTATRGCASGTTWAGSRPPPSSPPTGRC